MRASFSVQSSLREGFPPNLFIRSTDAQFYRMSGLRVTMASKGTNIFKLHTFCVITGASKGLGRCMAVQFGRRFAANSVLVLMARNRENLDQTAVLVKRHAPSITVKVIAVDLGLQDENYFDNCFKQVLGETNMQPQDFDQAMIVHNAGSMGDVSKRLVEIGVSKHIREYFDLNVTSTVTLNSSFLRCFSGDKVAHKLVVNLSSICALQPFKTWSLYCAGKAARDMLFRTMALEEPNIRVLNYAPGPIDTDMQLTARSLTGDKELKKLFSDMHTDGKLLSCEESIGRLQKLLELNTFDTGAHIDYYDL